MTSFEDEMWKASERRYHDELEQHRRKEWREYHEAQMKRIERLAMSLIEEHRAKAQALLGPSVSVEAPGISEEPSVEGGADGPEA